MEIENVSSVFLNLSVLHYSPDELFTEVKLVAYVYFGLLPTTLHKCAVYESEP